MHLHRAYFDLSAQLIKFIRLSIRPNVKISWVARMTET